MKIKIFYYLLILIVFLISCTNIKNLSHENINDSIIFANYEDSLVIGYNYNNKIIIGDSRFEYTDVSEKENYIKYEKSETIDKTNNTPTDVVVNNPLIYNLIYETSNYGDINYILNDTMILNKLNIVYLTISDSVEKNIIINDIPTFNENNIVNRRIRISPKMRVRLIDITGINFKITPITDEIQLIENNQYTKWQWEIIPLTSGEHKLILSIDIIYENVNKNIKIYEDFIYVYSEESTWDKIINFLKEQWIWVFSTIITPLVMIVVIDLFKKYIYKPKTDSDI